MYSKLCVGIVIVSVIFSVTLYLIFSIRIWDFQQYSFPMDTIQLQKMRPLCTYRQKHWTGHRICKSRRVEDKDKQHNYNYIQRLCLMTIQNIFSFLNVIISVLYMFLFILLSFCYNKATNKYVSLIQ